MYNAIYCEPTVCLIKIIHSTKELFFKCPYCLKPPQKVENIIYKVCGWGEALLWKGERLKYLQPRRPAPPAPLSPLGELSRCSSVVLVRGKWGCPVLDPVPWMMDVLTEGAKVGAEAGHGRRSKRAELTSQVCSSSFFALFNSCSPSWIWQHSWIDFSLSLTLSHKNSTKI